MTGSRDRISLSWMRQNATTGAPMRSEPKLEKSLGMLSFHKGGDRHQFCRGHHSLTTSAMNSYLEHEHPPFVTLVSVGAAASPCADLTLCAGSPASYQAET